jgi:hypothetical protein
MIARLAILAILGGWPSPDPTPPPRSLLWKLIEQPAPWDGNWRCPPGFACDARLSTRRNP